MSTLSDSITSWKLQSRKLQPKVLPAHMPVVCFAVSVLEEHYISIASKKHGPWWMTAHQDVDCKKSQEELP
jgi:hypothetical protein